jgi:outer membrane protein OmpA-like peptidoglycan-associated protein
MMKNFSIVFAIVIGCAANSYADSIQAHHFRFGDTLETPMMEDALGKNSELVQSENRFLFRASYDFANDMITGSTTAHPDSFPFINDLQTLSVGGSTLLHTRILAGIDIPLHYVRLSTSYTQGAFDPTSVQFGDMSLYAKWRLSPDDNKINIAIRPEFTLPTGSDEYLLSDDSYGIGGQVILDTSAGRWKFFANAGMNYASNAEFSTINRKTTVGYGLGTFYKINSRFGLNGELIQSISTSDVSNGQSPTLMNFGLRYSSGLAKFFIGGGVHRFKFSSNNHPISLYAGVKLPLGSKKTLSSVSVPAETQATIQTTSPSDPQLDSAFESLSSTVIYFSKNSFVLKKEHEEALHQISQQLISRRNQVQYIIVSGHSDPRGDEAYNQLLSEKRAFAVQKYLIQQGVDQQTLITKGYGEIGSTSTDENGYPKRSTSRISSR